MGFVEISVCFMIFVVLSVAETVVAIFLNSLGDEDWVEFFLMMLLSCAALAITITYLLSINSLI